MTTKLISAVTQGLGCEAHLAGGVYSGNLGAKQHENWEKDLVFLVKDQVSPWVGLE